MCENCDRELERERERRKPIGPAECVACAEMCEGDELKRADNQHFYCLECYNENFVECEDCECETPIDEAVYSESSEAFCDSCYHSRYGSCDDCGGETNLDHLQEGYCPDCFSEHCCNCAGCGNAVTHEDALTHDGDDWCAVCYHDRYMSCDECGEVYHRNEMRGYYCRDCADNSCDEEEDEYNREPQTISLEDNTYLRTGSQRTFGVELETSECPGFKDLRGRTHFDDKADGSIDGREFVSTILAGDKGLDAIADFCGRANRMKFKIDSKCGFHLHVGVGDFTIEELKAVAIAYNLTYQAWCALVPNERQRNHYCAKNNWIPARLNRIKSIDQFADFCCETDRYQWFNLNSFYTHGTFEIRLHSATLDGDKVCNWALAHVRFIDAASKMTQAEIETEFSERSVQEQFASIAKMWGDAALADYYVGRAAKFGNTIENPLNAVAASE